MTLQVNSAAKTATLEAKIIRADGTVEDLGVIGYMNANPVKNFVMNLYYGIKRILR